MHDRVRTYGVEFDEGEPAVLGAGRSLVVRFEAAGSN